PGASDAAVEDSVSLASAVSLNIETPGKSHFQLLSQKKDYMSVIIRPIKLMARLTERGNRHERVKCTTQFIVGASDEKDSEIIDYSFSIYKKLRFQRVYFSAYQRGLGNPGIPGENRPLEPEGRFMREHRLYQTDFLIRKYGFTREDIILDSTGNLRLDKDPKEIWAESHPEFFPLRLNSSAKESLLKAPGLGPETVSRIIKARKEGKINRLEDLGLKGKRLAKAQRYVICE
ncbi:MAG: hypothetical protein WC291_08140, partial [Thermodesulfovibrionales bacterium]